MPPKKKGEVPELDVVLDGPLHGVKRARGSGTYDPKIVVLFATLVSIVMGLVTKPRRLAERESRHPRVQRVLSYP